jgi:hypothetical protein
MKIGASMYAVGIVGGILSSMISLVSFTFGTLLFAPGIALAYILPLLPFIHFVFAVFGWILALVEAVIEIPIFALAHLDPEGEGVFPQATRAAYHLLLQLILRPLLICIGLIVSILLMNGMIDFVNLVFKATVFAVQTNSSVSIFSQIIYTIIYAGLVYSICNSCFKAIDYIPNHALRWIGASGDMHDSSQGAGYATAAAMGAASAAQQMGQIGQQLGGNVAAGTRALGAGAAGGLTKTAGGGANSAGSVSAPAAQVANSVQSSGDTVGRGFNAAQMAGHVAATDVSNSAKIDALLTPPSEPPKGNT